MKVLSLLQPWATLFVRGLKVFETRSWPTHYRGPVFIHASGELNKRYKDSQMTPALQSLEPVFKDHIKPSDLVFGKIIGMVNIAAVLRTEEIKPFLSEQDIAFGDYSPGRWAWQCYDHVSFLKGTSLKGQLGVRDCPVSTFCSLCDGGHIPSGLLGHVLLNGDTVQCLNYPDLRYYQKGSTVDYSELIDGMQKAFKF